MRRSSRSSYSNLASFIDDSISLIFSSEEPICKAYFLLSSISILLASRFWISLMTIISFSWIELISLSYSLKRPFDSKLLFSCTWIVVSCMAKVVSRSNRDFSSSVFEAFRFWISLTRTATSICSSLDFFSLYISAFLACLFNGETCLSSSERISKVRSRFSLVLSSLFNDSIFLFLYLDTPAASSKISRRS